MSVDLLVLGAGPAGLAAAWQGARRGLSVTLLERSPEVGGMARSLEVAGMRVDLGSHRLHPATPAPLLADLRALLGEDLQLRPRNGRLRVEGRWVGFPLRPRELARTLPKPLLARAALDAATAPLRRPADSSYAGSLRAGLGPTLYEALYGPYAGKLWGLAGEQISAEQARRRVSADTPWKLAARLARSTQRTGGTGQGRAFYYPRRGFGQLPEALADAAGAAGATLRTEAEVEGLVITPGGAAACLAGGEQVLADHVFSTVPLPVLARLTAGSEHAAPVPVREAASRLRFRAMVLVYLVVEGGRWTSYDAHYLPGVETPVTRISEPANYRDSADDPRDRTVLCAEIPCDVGDGMWRAGDEELAAVVTDTLARTGLPVVRPTAVQVVRLPHVYPVYERGYEQPLAALDDWAATLPHVTTFGRLGLFAHDNTHHAMAMAYDAVDALRKGSWDPVAWAAARERFAAHVVED